MSSPPETSSTTEPCHCATLRKAARRASAHYDAALAPAGVTVAQFSLLRTIAREGATSLTRLGRLTELERSTVGRNVRVLERQGFVALAPGGDQREARIALTAAGRQRLTAAIPLWQRAQQALEARLGAATAELNALLAAV